MQKKYNFDKLVDRNNVSSEKWNFSDIRSKFSELQVDPIPMWVADMDFKTAPVIIDALRNDIDHGVFGYTLVTEKFNNTVRNWQYRKHSWKISSDWVLQTDGGVVALSHIVQTFSNPGDVVLVQMPVYHRLFDIPLMNDRKVINAPLQRVGNEYHFSPTRFEYIVKTNKPSLFLFCSPHNPVGKVWNKDELLQICDICKKYGVTIISDELHADLIHDNKARHVPIASVSDKFVDNIITITSPSKTFNLPGMRLANVIISDPSKRNKLRSNLDRGGHFIVSDMAITAGQAALGEGDTWHLQLLEYLSNNYQLIKYYLENYIPSIKLINSSASYLAWIDISQLKISDIYAWESLIKNGVWVSSGSEFGQGGKGFIRLNFGCPRAVLEEALRRIAKWVSCINR